MSVDVHAHCLPAELMGALVTEGADFGVDLTDDRRVVFAGGRPSNPIRDDLIDFDLRVMGMDRAGIDLQVLSCWINLTAYGLDAANGERWSRRVNEALAAEAARDPDRFLAIATVPLQEPELAAAELRYATTELGMVGVEIATAVDGTDLVAAGLEPFWAAAAELGSLILFHPMEPLPELDLSRHFLHNLVGRPAVSTITISRLIMAGLFDHHPQLNVCVVHGGGFLPYGVGRLQRGWVSKPNEVATDLDTPPMETIKRLYYDTVVHNPLALRYLIDMVGADRIMVGTDYPFESGDHDPITTVDAIPGLTTDERRWIVSGTAEKLLGR